MLNCPFDIVSCSWPRPVEQENNRWISEPEWDTPLMPVLPRSYLEMIHDEWLWVFNWSDFFRCDLKATTMGREMRGFHVLFVLKMKYDGLFIFRDDDGCIIRRDGKIIYCNRNTKQISQGKIEVKAGELLEIAQWHSTREWIWGAYLLSSSDRNDFAVPPNPIDTLTPYLEQVQDYLHHPNGPPLKLFTNGRTSVRTIVGIYSLILNGYVPSAVYLFGDYQWHKPERELLKQLLPFAQIVPVTQVLTHLGSVGGSELVDLAIKHWFVMKTGVSLLYPPYEFCMMDDDVFILDRLDDALEAFRTNNLVYTINYDHGAEYVEAWRKVYKEPPWPLPTANFNAGLYWLRNTKDPGELATQVLQVPPNTQPQNWEQGFIALAYAQESSFELPFHRYYAPAMDGFPGGTLGYDYAQNPCRFASIHFLGVFKFDKPSDGKVLYLVPQILRTGDLRPTGFLDS